MSGKVLVFIVAAGSFYFSSAAHTGGSEEQAYKDIYPQIADTSVQFGVAVNSSAELERVPLYFGLMMSFGGDVKSSGAIPGVQVALDAINNQPDLLPGYTLHYTLTDSQVYICMPSQSS